MERDINWKFKIVWFKLWSFFGYLTHSPWKSSWMFARPSTCNNCSFLTILPCASWNAFLFVYMSKIIKCGPACQVCVLPSHQFHGPPACTVGLPAAGRHLYPSEWHNTEGPYNHSHIPGCTRERLSGFLFQLHLPVHRRAVPHNDSADGPGHGQHHGPGGQHSEPTDKHDCRVLPLHTSLHLRRCPRGRQRCHCPAARDLGPAAAWYSAGPEEQEQRKAEATAAGTAEADDTTPGLNTREERTLKMERASHSTKGSGVLQVPPSMRRGSEWRDWAI